MRCGCSKAQKPIELTAVVPVVESCQYKHVPPVVRVTDVVHFAGEPTLRYPGDVDQEGRARQQIHHHHAWNEQLRRDPTNKTLFF